MAAGKWIGGVLGWIAGGPLGALAGLVIGALFDHGLNSVNNAGNAGTFTQEDTGYGNANGYGQQQEYEGRRNSFLFSLLVLASYIIRADGRVMHSEMELMRRFLRSNFGEPAVGQGEQILRNLFNEQKRQGYGVFQNTVADCCAQIAANMSYSERLQLLNFLAMIAKADGQVADEEIQALRNCSSWLGMREGTINSMLNLDEDSLSAAYQVLGVSPSATDDEVRAAYKRLVRENHTDHYEKLGGDILKAAERKMQEINAAKDKVYKARGM